MKIPSKYANLEPVNKAVLGYSTTVVFMGLLGYLYEPILIGLMIIAIIISIGVFIMPYISPYYLTWSIGASMMPSIPLGLTLILSSEKTDKINTGDVISYISKNDERHIHHRIIDSNSYGYIVKGDGNDIKDPETVKKDQVNHKSVQYGCQPIYIPISPLAIIMTVLKAYKKLQGKHKSIIKENISY